MVTLWYEDAGTVIHRLTPFTKVYLLVTLCVCAQYWKALEFKIPILLLTLAILLIAKVPRAWVSAVLALQVAALPVGLYSALFTSNPDFFYYLPKSITETWVFRLTGPDFHIGPILLGQLGWSFGGLYWLFSNTLYGFIAFFAIFTLIYTISPSQQVQALNQMHAPPALCFIFTLAWRFLTVITRQTERVVAAQSLRGFVQQKKSRNPITLAKEYMPVVLPFIHMSVAMIDEVTIAAETRGFGSGRMSPIYVWKVPAKEWVVIGLTTVLLVGMLISTFVYHIGLV